MADMARYLQALTGRGVTKSRRGGKPLIHAVTFPPRLYASNGHTWAAVCGAQVSVYTSDPFVNGATRTCPSCNRKVETDG